MNNRKYLEGLTSVEIYKEVLTGNIKQFPDGFWCENNPDLKRNMKECISYLIDEVLHWGIDDVKEKMKTSVLVKNRLSTVAKRYKLYDVIEVIYGDKIKAWEMVSLPSGFWLEDKNRINYIKWVVDKHNIEIEDIPNNVSKIGNEIFKNNRLLYVGYNIVELITEAYPGKFKPWEIKHTKSSFWKDEQNIIDALDWYVTTVVKLPKKSEFKFIARDLYSSKLKSLILFKSISELQSIYDNYIK